MRMLLDFIRGWMTLSSIPFCLEFFEKYAALVRNFRQFSANEFLGKYRLPRNGGKFGFLDQRMHF